MGTTHDRFPFGLALGILLVGIPLMFMPFIREGGVPNWTEPIFVMGTPTLICVLFLFLGNRQRAFRIPLMLLLCLPMGIIELMINNIYRSGILSRDVSRSIPPLAIACVFFALTTLYIFRVLRRNPRPRVAWVKMIGASLAGTLTGLFLIFGTLNSLRIDFIRDLWENQNKNLVLGILATIVCLGVVFFGISHLIDLWKNGPTAEEKPDYEQLIASIKGNKEAK